MKRVDIWMRLVCTGIVLFFAVFDHEVRAQSVEGKWGIGVRGGGAFSSENVSSDVDSKTGPIVSGNILYGLSDMFSVGLNMEWEKHDIEFSGRGVGEAKTTSIIPFVEWRPMVSGAASHYVSLGLGVNINSFSHDKQRTILSEDLTAEEIADLSITPGKIDPDNTLAIKISGGFDYFATENLAVNTEVGWRSNSGDVEFCSISSGCETRDWNASIFTALLGLRYYF
jgi:outer membrane protein